MTKKAKEPKCSHKVNQTRESVNWKELLWDTFCSLAKLLDMFPSSIIWLSVVVYRSVVGRWPLFLKEFDTLKKSNHSKETEIQLLKSLIERKDNDKEKEVRQSKKLIESKNKESRLSKDREIEHLKNVIESKDKESELKSKMIKSLEDEVNQVNHNLKTKVTENAELEAEKKEALRSNDSKETEIQQLKSLIERKDKESREDKEKEVRQLKKLIESKNKESRLSKDREIQHLKNVIESKDKESGLKSKMIKSLEDEVNQVNHNLKTKVTENAELEAEKKEALRRLSEEVSIKLRDNNPNVVDLKDPCRPTKLAEMFSELYDNEWTSAYFVLAETFSEKYAISILLHAVMSAYEVSKGRAEESWQILRDWFLDESLPGAELTTKWLKDSRKINVKRKVSEIGTDFKEKDFKVYLSSMCGDYKVKTFLSDGAIDTYLLKCIELCLLMVSTDPPVVLACPGWESTHTLHIHDTNMEESSLNERREGQNCVVENWSADDRNMTQQNLYDQHIQSGREEQKAIREKSLTGRKNAIERGKTQKLTEQRVSFDKELFKKYTSRGNYIDYVVWPAMLLHTDGPLLRKGIAQGT